MATIITRAKRDTTPFTVTVPHANLAAADGLGSYSDLWFYGKLSVTDPDSASTGQPQALFKKTLADGITVTVDGNNTDTDAEVSITLAPEDTASLPDLLSGISIYCSLKGDDGSGNEYTIAGGPDSPIVLVVGTAPTSGAHV